MKQKSLKINAILNFIRSFIGLIFPLITFPYSSRVLLPEGIGRVNFAQSIVSYFIIIAGIGIYSYGIREAAKVREDKVGLSHFVKEIFIINIISTAVAYILFAVALLVVPRFKEYRVILCICSATIIFTTIGLEWLYIAIEDYVYISIRSIAIQIISVILLFTFVKTQDDYLKYAAIAVVSGVGSNLMNFIHSRKIVNFKTGMRLELKRHLKPIFILFATCVAVQIYSALDTTMLGFLCNEWYVGIYSAATKVNKVVLSGLLAVFATMMPRLSYYAGKNDKTEYINLVYKSLDFILLISIPCTIGLNLLSRDVVLLLSGQEFIDAITPMKIMNPIIIIIGLNNFFSSQVFLPLNKERYTLFAVMAGTICNFALNFILIPLNQANGAAIATLAAESIVCLINFILGRNTINFLFVLKRIVIYGLNCVVMAIPVLCCVYFIHVRWISLLCSIIAGVITYFTILYIEHNKLLLSIVNSIKVKLKNKCIK